MWEVTTVTNVPAEQEALLVIGYGRTNCIQGVCLEHTPCCDRDESGTQSLTRR